MKFPEWAPKDVCDYYNRLAERHPEEDREREQLLEEKTLLERLLTNPTMIPVWKAFAQKRTTDGPICQSDCPLFESVGDRDLSYPLFYMTKHNYLPSGKRCMTRSEIIEKLRRIVKSANDLSRAVQNTPYNGSPFGWLNEGDQLKILENINIEHPLPKYTALPEYIDRRSEAQIRRQALGVHLQRAPLHGLKRQLWRERSKCPIKPKLIYRP